MEPWHIEVVELYEFLEGYFLGKIDIDDVSRLESALDPDFSIINPEGEVSSREDTISTVRKAHGYVPRLKITITEPTLLTKTSEVVVARYVENHKRIDGASHRWSTVVFIQDDRALNGLRWRTLQETWLDRASA